MKWFITALLFTLSSYSLAFGLGSKNVFPVRTLARTFASTRNFSLISRQKREFFSRPKSISTDAQVEDAIRLGQSELEKYFQFPLDDWQLQAGGSILMGHNVIVCAPTGSGKTVVGEMALHAAFDRDLDGVYTTPLKALSNQKFSEMRQIFGSTNVGLSTGDISINRDSARLTVMTTEVYRNIAWRSSGGESDAKEMKTNDLSKNSVVVLDEFHYMGQPGRGGKVVIFHHRSLLSSTYILYYCAENSCLLAQQIKTCVDLRFRGLGRVCYYITFSYANSRSLGDIGKRERTG